MALMKHITVGIIASAGLGVFLTGCKSDDKKPTTPPKTDADKDKDALQKPGPDSTGKQRTQSVKPSRQENLAPADFPALPKVEVDPEQLKQSAELLKKRQADFQLTRLKTLEKTSEQKKKELEKTSTDLKAKFRQGNIPRAQLQNDWNAAIQACGLAEHELVLFKEDMAPWLREIQLGATDYDAKESNTKSSVFGTDGLKIVVDETGKERKAYHFTWEQIQSVEKTFDLWRQSGTAFMRNGAKRRPQVRPGKRLETGTFGSVYSSTRAKWTREWFRTFDAPTKAAFADYCEELAESPIAKTRVAKLQLD